MAPVSMTSSNPAFKVAVFFETKMSKTVQDTTMVTDER